MIYCIGQYEDNKLGPKSTIIRGGLKTFNTNLNLTCDRPNLVYVVKSRK